MFIFLLILQLLLSLAVLGLGLALNLDYPWVQSWPTSTTLLLVAGAYSLFVVIVINFFFGGTGATGLLLFFNVTAFILDLTAFILALSGFPYTAGCDSSDYSGCQTLKAAIGLDCVLWITFLVGCVAVCVGNREVVERERMRSVRMGPVYYA